MVQVFEPDEAAPMPYLMKMIAPADRLYTALHQFVFYEYYYYGFPHFGYSALLMFPLRWFNQLENIPLRMLVLRQGTSVFLMLAAVLLLTCLQDRFSTYRSYIIFFLLNALPAVLHNNFWWHPDGLVTFLAVAVLFLLVKDDLRLGRYFLLSAILCGILTAVKLVGFYFFLAIASALLGSFFTKKSSCKKMVAMGALFIVIMAVSILAANPFLLSSWARDSFLSIFARQQDWLFNGYELVYQKGMAAAWPVLRENYGSWLFLLLALMVNIWAGVRSPQKWVCRFILAWFFPLTVMILVFSHFKFQYWLPVALPLISSLGMVFPPKIEWSGKSALLKGMQMAAMALIMLQALFFMKADVQLFKSRFNQAEEYPAIHFYEHIQNSLSQKKDQVLTIYADPHIYIPAQEDRVIETSYEMLNFDYIEQGNFDAVILMEQSLRDYLNDNSAAINSEKYGRAQLFYRSASQGNLPGYELVFRDDFGLIFLKK